MGEVDPDFNNHSGNLRVRHSGRRRDGGPAAQVLFRAAGASGLGLGLHDAAQAQIFLEVEMLQRQRVEGRRHGS